MKKTKRIILGMAVLSVAFGWTSPLWSAPDIHSAAPAFEFGAVDNTTTIKHAFELTNTGDAPLVIGQIKPSCGCTVANISSKNLAPGEVAVLKVDLNLTGRSGNQYKTISVHSNDPDERIYQLKMTGKAIPEIEVIPASVSFGVIAAGAADVSKLSRKITLKTTKDKPFKIQSVTALRKQVTTQLSVVEEGKQYEILIEVKEQDFKGGMLRDTLSIRTDNPKSPIVSVPVYATVRDLLTVIPNPLKLSSAVKVPVTRYITVRGGSVQSFEVLSASCFECDSEIDLVVQNKGRYGYRIQLNNLDVSKINPGQKVIVKTNVQGRETIEIPIEVVSPVTVANGGRTVVRPAPTPQRVVPQPAQKRVVQPVVRPSQTPNAVVRKPTVVRPAPQTVVSEPKVVPAPPVQKNVTPPPTPKRLPPPDTPLIFRAVPPPSK